MRGTLQQAKQEKQFSTLPEELARHLGQNAVLRRLIQEGLPLTVKNYVDMNYWGQVPENIDEEDQSVIDALHHYESSQKHQFGPAAAQDAVKTAKQLARGRP
jgi:methylphosphotriester-DNA--protein-cysteine methyltransferase